MAAGGSGGRRGSDGSGNGASSGLRYERVEQIGSGTFGHAWLVKSRASGRQYVVKEIKVTSLPVHEREQSVNEVAILSQCKHVNIIRYKEAFIEQASGSLNIVMEYADGGKFHLILGHELARFCSRCISVGVQRNVYKSTVNKPAGNVSRNSET